MVARLAVLDSNSDVDSESVLQAILDACASQQLAAVVVIAISNHPGVGALDVAGDAGVTALYHPLQWYLDTQRTQSDYDAALIDLIAPYDPDWVVLVDWAQGLTGVFLARYHEKIIDVESMSKAEAVDVLKAFINTPA